MRSFRDIEISIEEINVIEGIKIVLEFKCIAKSECQKIYNIIHSIEKYYKNIHD